MFVKYGEGSEWIFDLLDLKGLKNLYVHLSNCHIIHN